MTLQKLENNSEMTMYGSTRTHDQLVNDFRDIMQKSNETFLKNKNELLDRGYLEQNVDTALNEHVEKAMAESAKRESQRKS
jgi:hypothetical protein